MFVRDEIIKAAVTSGLNSREFCGDWRAAIVERLADLGVTGEDRKRAAKVAAFRVNAVWNKWQREAGVNEKHIF